MVAVSTIGEGSGCESILGVEGNRHTLPFIEGSCGDRKGGCDDRGRDLHVDNDELVIWLQCKQEIRGRRAG